MKFPRDFKGVWIPKEIWLHPELSMLEKCLAAEINSLDGDDNCYAGNEYFAKFFGVTERHIRRAISNLKKLGIVEQVNFDGRIRYLCGWEKVKSGQTGQKCPGRPVKNVPPDTKNIHIDENTEEKTKEESDAPLGLSSKFFSLIKKNDPKAKQPNLEKWAVEIRRMHEIDGRSYEEIEKLILFAAQDEFWSSNILSPAKLRKHATKLTIAMKKPTTKSKSKQRSWESDEDDVNWGKKL